MDRPIIDALNSSNRIFTQVFSFIYQSYFKSTQNNSNPMGTENAKVTLESLKGTFVSSSIVSFYKPYSIDYFMMNITSLAPYEFFDIRGNNTKKTERRKNIHLYTKLIITNYLSYSTTYAQYAVEEDNYIKQMVWKLIQDTHFYNEKFENFIINNFNLINFNYDLSFETMLYEFISKEAADKLLSKFQSVYGKIYFEVNEGGGKAKNLIEYKHDAIWEALFFNNGNDTFSIPGKMTVNRHQCPIYSCQNMFDQIDKQLKWIGELDKEAAMQEREKFQKLLLDADKVYFLGFGFDFNNLYHLGIIDENYNLDSNISDFKGKMSILISGSTPKIIASIKTIFDAEVTDKIDSLTVMKTSKGNINITFSVKLLPEALSDDLQ